MHQHTQECYYSTGPQSEADWQIISVLVTMHQGDEAFVGYLLSHYTLIIRT